MIINAYYTFIGVYKVEPRSINFSQSSVNGLVGLTKSMQTHGWKLTKSPINIVKIKDGTLVTLDNTRVLAAHNVGIKTRAIIRNADDSLPKKYTQLERFATKKDGNPLIWGEAVQFRINKQKNYSELLILMAPKLQEYLTSHDRNHTN